MSSPPNEFECALGLSLMRDPVSTPYGHTFERARILEWLRVHAVCPITDNALRANQLVPNIALRQAIETWLAQHPDYVPEEPASELQGEWCIVNAVTDEWNVSTVTINTQVAPRPLDLIIVVDVSGSMDTETFVYTNAGERDGLTRQDMVNHAARTVASMQGPDDHVGLVSFCTEAKVVRELGHNRPEVLIDDIQTMTPTTSTNLWGGIELAVQQLELKGRAGANKVVMVLTDGEPNYHPPLGYDDAVRKAAARYAHLHMAVHTFAYGYRIESDLLCRIANALGGAYTFIPEAGMIGTVFINAMAAARCTVSQDVKLVVRPAVDKVLGGLAQDPTGAIDLRHVHAGQPRSAVFLGAGRHVDLYVDGALVTSASFQPGTDPDQTGRALLVESLATPADAPQTLVGSPFLDALHKDVRGQVAEAREDGHYRRWGRHFLPSLAAAHRDQRRNNFKDPGVQMYGGDRFKTLQDEGDVIFAALAPPVPTKANRTLHAISSTYVSARYNSADNPCFAGSSLIDTETMGAVAIEDLVPGVMLRTPVGPRRVVVIVKTTLQTNGTVSLCELSDSLTITPYHPVKDAGETWRFPADIKPPTEVAACPVVYNLVVEGGQPVFSGAYVCATIGHSCRDNDVIEHPFFGSYKTALDLEQHARDGIVRLTQRPGLFARDPVTHVVTGINWALY